MANRLLYISILQVFAVFMVVIGHSVPDNEIINSVFWMKSIYKFIYCFHVPLLFSISSFLFFYTFKEDVSIKQFLFKKFERLLIPYFFINFLAWFVKLFFSNFVVNKNLSLLSMFIYPWNAPIPYLWFIVALFWMLILSKLIAFKFKFNNKVWVLIFSIATLLSLLKFPVEKDLFAIHSFMHFYVYFVFGLFIAKYKGNLLKCFNYKLYSLLSLVAILSFWIPSDTRVLYLFRAIFLIYYLFMLAYKLASNNFKLFYGIFDNYYYQIFLLQWFGMALSRCLYKIGIVNYSCNFFINVLAGIGFSYIIVILTKKYLTPLCIFIGLPGVKNVKSNN